MNTLSIHAVYTHEIDLSNQIRYKVVLSASQDARQPQYIGHFEYLVPTYTQFLQRLRDRAAIFFGNTHREYSTIQYYDIDFNLKTATP